MARIAQTCKKLLGLGKILPKKEPRSRVVNIGISKGILTQECFALFWQFV